MDVAFEIGTSYEARFSADGSLLAVVGRSHVGVWDTARGRRIGSAPRLQNPSSVDFSPDGARLALKNTSGDVVVAALPEREEVARFEGAGEGASIRFAPDGAHLVDSNWSGRLMVRDALTGDVVWSERGGTIMRMACSRDRSLWVYDRSGGEGGVLARRWPFDRHEPEVLPDVPSTLALAVSDDGRRVATDNSWVTVLERTDGGWERLGHRTDLRHAPGAWALAWAGDTLVRASGAHLYVLDATLNVVSHTTVERHMVAADADPTGTLVALGAWSDGAVVRV